MTALRRSGQPNSAGAKEWNTREKAFQDWLNDIGDNLVSRHILSRQRDNKQQVDARPEGRWHMRLSRIITDYKKREAFPQMKCTLTLYLMVSGFSFSVNFVT